MATNGKIVEGKLPPPIIAAYSMGRFSVSAMAGRLLSLHQMGKPEGGLRLARFQNPDILQIMMPRRIAKSQGKKGRRGYMVHISSRAMESDSGV